MCPRTHLCYRGGGVFCAGVINLILRAVGKRVPTYGNPLYGGDTLAYAESYRGYTEPFNLVRALEVARETRSGVLIGWPFPLVLRWGTEARLLRLPCLLRERGGISLFVLDWPAAVTAELLALPVLGAAVGAVGHASLLPRPGRTQEVTWKTIGFAVTL